MEQTLILVDQHDRQLGYAPRRDCHQGEGLLHRAIVVVLVDAAGRLLLQQRRSSLWDGYWDITGATHPLHLDDRDESYLEAAQRCLADEWAVVDAPLALVTAFQYFAPFGDHCEHEYCALLTGRWERPVRLNPAHGYAQRWLAPADCRAEMAAQPAQFTPWAHLTLAHLTGPTAAV
jgi:isopentenyl-diphosphate delta-isomerase